MLGQQLSRPADQAGGRLRASDGNDIHEQQEFFPTQSAHRAGFVFEFGFKKLCGEVVGGVIRTPVNEFGEHLPIGQAVGIIQLPATLGADASVAVLLEKVLKVLWDAEEHADHAQRHD